MGTDDLAKACAESLKNSDTAIMKNHGAICLGKTLFGAFDRMEVLEFTAHMYFNTLVLNNCQKLDEKELKKIDGLK